MCVNKQREAGMTKNYIPHKKILTHIIISTDRLVYLGNCQKQSTFLVSYPHAWQVYKLSISLKPLFPHLESCHLRTIALTMLDHRTSRHVPWFIHGTGSPRLKNTVDAN